ncbi:MAG: deoxyribose-phosphate aldolase [Microcoleaceae cyanobacterium]
MIDNSIEIDLAPLIDHTFLNPIASPQQIEQYCDQALRYQFAAVCVYPSYVRLVTEQLRGKSPQICTVIGFPSGATTPAVKLYEAQEAVENGATELDVMVNLSWVKLGQTQKLYQEIAEICENTGQTVKAIIETAVLTDPEKRLAIEVLIDAGVSWVQTNTGWYGGATIEDVKLLKQLSKGQLGIKAAGQIRTVGQAADLILAGAARLGTSYSVEIVRGQNQPEEDNNLM